MAGALVIFAFTYALITARRLGFLAVSRPAAALAGAAACVLFGILTPSEAYASIDGDTLALLLGMMILAAHLDHAGFFEWGASITLRTVRRPEHLLTIVVFSVGILSAFLVNDVVCFLMTPVIVRVIRSALIDWLGWHRVPHDETKVVADVLSRIVKEELSNGRRD